MILCCGEALIDMIPTDATGTPTYGAHVGGAVFNTAVSLGRLGRKVHLLSGVSHDPFGAQLAQALEDSQVGIDYLVRSDRPTTLAFVTLTDGHAKYMFYDENTAGRMLSVQDLPVLGDDIGALFFGGISLACEPGADTYAAFLSREGAQRAVVMDPNIRLGFAPDEDRYRVRQTQMLAQADLVKVSDEDLAWVIPDVEGLENQARALQALGPAVVIVTRGGDGAMGLLPDGTFVSVSAPKVDVIDTVGAGDTFNAGTIAKLDEMGLLTKSALRGLSGEDLQTAMANGAAVAAITVTRAGANPPWLSEL